MKTKRFAVDVIPTFRLTQTDSQISLCKLTLFYASSFLLQAEKSGM